MKKISNVLPTTMGDSGRRLLQSQLGVKLNVANTRAVMMNYIRDGTGHSEKLPTTGKNEKLELQKVFSIRWSVKSETGLLFCLAIFMLLCSHLSLYLQIRNLDSRNSELEVKIQDLVVKLEECVVAEDYFGADQVVVGEDTAGNRSRNGGRQRRDADYVDDASGAPAGTNVSDSSSSSSRISKLPRSLTEGRMRKGSRGKVKSGQRFRRLKKRLLVLSTRLMKASEPRAVHLLPMADLVTVRKKDQIIGPWLFMENGTDLGFTEHNMWYKNIRLDESLNSVIFQENGLYQISAQVYFYKDRPSTSAKLLGFKIYLRKNPKKWAAIQRSIPLAECIPAQPDLEFQTCFTQVTWFLEEGDAIYLSNYMDGMLQIHGETQGQTFLTIVKL